MQRRPRYVFIVTQNVRLLHASGRALPAAGNTDLRAPLPGAASPAGPAGAPGPTGPCPHRGWAGPLGGWGTRAGLDSLEPTDSHEYQPATRVKQVSRKKSSVKNIQTAFCIIYSKTTSAVAGEQLIYLNLQYLILTNFFKIRNSRKVEYCAHWRFHQLSFYLFVFGYSLCDLSFPTKDQTPAHSTGGAESPQLDYQETAIKF